jgi:hypothetical protein
MSIEPFGSCFVIPQRLPFSFIIQDGQCEWKLERQWTNITYITSITRSSWAQGCQSYVTSSTDTSIVQFAEWPHVITHRYLWLLGLQRPLATTCDFMKTDFCEIWCHRILLKFAAILQFWFNIRQQLSMFYVADLKVILCTSQA